MNTDNIGILLVLFNPSEDDLASASAVAQHYRGAIVDNSPCRSFTESIVGKMAYIPLLSNKGIAHAQNVGLRYILEQNDIDYIVFFDQDSRFPNTYPQDMVNEYAHIKNAYPRLALLGPTVVDNDTNEEYKSVFHKTEVGDNSFIIRRDVISSGSVVARDVLKSVGLMIDSLFIDYVDFEWCWRAQSKGLICGQTRNVSINHSVGINRHTFMGYMIQVWSPFRYFYQYRNYIWLSTLSYTPHQWIFATGVKSCLRLIYFPFIIRNGVKCWKQMWRGIFSAMCNFLSFRKEIKNGRRTT